MAYATPDQPTLLLKAPYGYPQGTGVTLKAQPGKPPATAWDIALTLADHGCFPKTAWNAAHCIIASGEYSARLMTHVALCRRLRQDMERLGLDVLIEASIPEGNRDHANDCKRAGRETWLNGYGDLEKLAQMVQDAKPD